VPADLANPDNFIIAIISHFRAAYPPAKGGLPAAGLGRIIILNMFSSTSETKFCNLPIIIACIFQAVYDSILALQCKGQGRWGDLFPSLPQAIPFLLLLKVFLIT